MMLPTLIPRSATLLALSLLMHAAPAQQGPAADIVGLKPGMSVDEVTASLQRSEEGVKIEVAESWIRQNHGLPTRQLLRAADGTPCAAGQVARNNGLPNLPCETHGGRFQARKDIGNEIIVAFAGMPGQEKAVSIWRRSVFAPGQNPSVASVEQALAEKYGKPNIRQTESGYYSTTHRHDAINLNWTYKPNGQRLTAPDSLKARCVNGPRPWFKAKHTWNSGCGVTLRAEIVPMPGSRLLAQELNVTLVNQADLLRVLKQFEADLKASVESSSGKKAAKPRL